jgi:heterodisulfide reductase subunit A2
LFFESSIYTGGTTLTAEELRIGVFVCDCGSNIAGVVDTEAVRACAAALPNVVVAVRNKYTCADPGQQEIQRTIYEQALNRVVVASCSPASYEPIFRDCIQGAGLNRYLLEMANIREHCSWVTKDREAATQKAKDIVQIAVARARWLYPQEEEQIPVTDAALVVGGGVAGIQAALDLADAGHRVYLVEKKPSIGGTMAQLDKIYPDIECSI